MSKNVLIICEGKTERVFVTSLLSQYLPHIDFHPFELGQCAGNRCGGGDIRYDRFKNDFAPVYRNPQYDLITTFFDYYGLGNGWPEVEDYEDMRNKVEKLEEKTLECIKVDFPDLSDNLFIPFFILHEFEGLLFSDTEAMHTVLRRPKVLFDNVIEECGEPELINNSPETAPSKRLINICGNYRKVVKGNRVARVTTIEKMRQECPHFNDWLTKLESLTD